MLPAFPCYHTHPVLITCLPNCLHTFIYIITCLPTTCLLSPSHLSSFTFTAQKTLLLYILHLLSTISYYIHSYLPPCSSFSTLIHYILLILHFPFHHSSLYQKSQESMHLLYLPTFLPTYLSFSPRSLHNKHNDPKVLPLFLSPNPQQPKLHPHDFYYLSPLLSPRCISFLNITTPV